MSLREKYESLGYCDYCYIPQTNYTIAVKQTEKGKFDLYSVQDDDDHFVIKKSFPTLESINPYLSKLGKSFLEKGINYAPQKISNFLK